MTSNQKQDLKRKDDSYVMTRKELAAHFRAILKKKEPIIKEILENVNGGLDKADYDTLNEKQREAYDLLDLIKWDLDGIIDRWDRIAKRGDASNLEQYVKNDWYKEEERARKLLLQLGGFEDED